MPDCHRHDQYHGRGRGNDPPELARFQIFCNCDRKEEDHPCGAERYQDPGIGRGEKRTDGCKKNEGTRNIEDNILFPVRLLIFMRRLQHRLIVSDINFKTVSGRVVETESDHALIRFFCFVFLFYFRNLYLQSRYTSTPASSVLYVPLRKPVIERLVSLEDPSSPYIRSVT